MTPRISPGADSTQVVDAPGLAVIDAGGLGAPIATAAMELAVKKAESAGIAAVASSTRGTSASWGRGPNGPLRAANSESS